MPLLPASRSDYATLCGAGCRRLCELVSSGDKILVTGGAGYIGSHFVRLAVEVGRDVVVLDDLSGGLRASVPSRVPLVVGDIGDQESVTRIVRQHRIGAVVHFAGKILVGESVTNPSLYFDVNVVRTLRLLEAVQHAGVGTFVFSSTAAVYGDSEQGPIPEDARLRPLNPYGATKLTIELALDAWSRAYGTRWAALRYFNAAGAHPAGGLRENHRPETHLIPLVLDAGLGREAPIQIFGDDYPTPDGTCIRDYVHVQDLAAAHLSAVQVLEGGHAIGPLNLGTGHGYSVKQVLEAAAIVLGTQVPHSVAQRRAGDPSSLVADPSRAMKLLSWRPQRSALATILEDTLRSRA